MKPVDLLISMSKFIHFNLVAPLGYFLFLCPALIRLVTDSKLWSHSLQSTYDVMYRVYVFGKININKDVKIFAHIQGNQIWIIFSNLRTTFYFWDEYLFPFQDEVSYRIPPSVFIGICHWWYL